MKTTTIALGLALLGACAPAAYQQRHDPPPPDPAVRAAEQEQAALQQRIDQARRALAAQPRAPREALDLCRAVEAAMSRRELLRLDVAALVAEAAAAIDGAISARGSEAPANGQAVVLKGMIGCYGKLRCDCVPAAVLPGAVLGQEPKPSAP